jgi:hypothetical protein
MDPNETKKANVFEPNPASTIARTPGSVRPPAAQPGLSPTPPTEPPDPQTMLEQWRAKHNPKDWEHNAAIAKRGWLSNSEVSEQDYIAALQEAANEEIR